MARKLNTWLKIYQVSKYSSLLCSSIGDNEISFITLAVGVPAYVYVCLCVCVCVRERERESTVCERENERECVYG